jgi:hypothetical protein
MDNHMEALEGTTQEEECHKLHLEVGVQDSSREENKMFFCK